MTHNPLIFDRALVRRRRDRAAAANNDFFLRELAERVADRLSDFKHSFDLALNLGARNGTLAFYTTGVGTWVQADLSQAMLSSAQGLCLVGDEEFLPFAENSFDLVVSLHSLHWVNDVPGALIQIRRSLKPGGLFIATLPGGETLKELRQSLEWAEMASRGGISPRVSPFIDIKDVGALLQRTGFSEPVVDSDMLSISYATPLALLQDLRAMGETNALYSRVKTMTGRTLMMQAMEYYRTHFPDEAQRVTASFEIVTVTAWKPGER